MYITDNVDPKEKFILQQAKHPFIIEGASTLEPYSGTFKKSQPRWTKSWTEFMLSSMIFYIIETPLPSLSK